MTTTRITSIHVQDPDADDVKQHPLEPGSHNKSQGALLIGKVSIIVGGSGSTVDTLRRDVAALDAIATQAMDLSRQLTEHIAELEAKADAQPDDDRQECSRCRDLVSTLSSDGLCDGCVHETTAAATR